MLYSNRGSALLQLGFNMFFWHNGSKFKGLFGVANKYNRLVFIVTRGLGNSYIEDIWTQRRRNVSYVYPQ